MKKNASRLIVFCAVMGFMLVGYNISFADTQSSNLQAAHFVPAAELPTNEAVTLEKHTPSTRQSVLELVLLTAIGLGSLLLLVYVLAFSAASMLPALPQVAVAASEKKAAVYRTAGRMKSLYPAPGPGVGKRFSVPYPHHHAV